MRLLAFAMKPTFINNNQHVIRLFLGPQPMPNQPKPKTLREALARETQNLTNPAAKTLHQTLTLCRAAVERGAISSKWNAARLGEQSPFAAPYFLGPLLHPTVDPSPAERGKVLLQQLLAVTDQLRAQDADTLRAYFFQRPRGRGCNAECVARQLRLNSEQSLYGPNGWLTQAVENLAEKFFASVVPLLRPEALEPVQLFGRTDLLPRLLAQLQQGQTLALTGAAGVGKTALATTLGAAWGNPQVLRYTIRPGLTDQLGSFFFALGYFLRELGRTALWAQVVAQGGQAKNPTTLLNLLEADLKTFTSRPLLWVDDVDLLHVADPATRPLRETLESLQGQLPLLLVGQPPLPLNVPPAQTHTLKGLSAAAIQQWFEHKGLPLTFEQATEAQTLTEGNPLQLALWLALYQDQTKESWADIARYTQQGAAYALFERIWHKRLTPDERTCLQYLAVFRQPAPQDEFPADLLQTLQDRHLVTSEGAGMVSTRDDIAQWVLSLTPAKEQTFYQSLAAGVWAKRGEYTQAAYYYLKIGEPKHAVSLWFNYREREKEKGQASTALALFRTLNLDTFKDHKTRLIWVITLSHLLGEAGELEAALQLLDSYEKSEVPFKHPARAFKDQLWATYLLERGQAEQAVARYQKALDELGAWTDHRKVYLYHARAHGLVNRLQQPERAQRDAWLAQLQVEKLWGQIAEAQNDYATAKQRYENALECAQHSGNPIAPAYAYEDLGRLAWMQSDFPTAFEQLHTAHAIFEQTQQRRQMLLIEMSLGAAHIMAKQYAEARQQLLTVVATAQAMQAPAYIAMSANNLAEACFYLGELAEAEHYARLALKTEEEDGRALVLTVLGHIARVRQQYAQANDFYAEAIHNAEALKNDWDAAFAWRGWGQNAVLTENRAEAQAYFAKASALFTALKLTKEVEETQRLVREAGLAA